MNPEWIVVGIILLGAMTAGGINLYLKRRKARLESENAQLAEAERNENNPSSDR